MHKFVVGVSPQVSTFAPPEFSAALPIVELSHTAVVVVVVHRPPTPKQNGVASTLISALVFV